MKVFLDYEIGDSGKSKFLKRLIPAMAKIGVEFRGKQDGCDVALGISKWRTKTKIPKVLRIDGVYIDGDGQRNEWINDQIKKSIKKSDAVIFQSQFAKKKVIEVLKPKIKQCCVIYNGANPEDYDVEPIDTGFERNVISVAKWCNRHGLRKQKGLKKNIKTMTAMAEKEPKTGFFIAGKVPDKYKDTDRIKFLGKIDEPILRRYLKACDRMVYMATLDWMPNALTEAIVAGCDITYNPDCESSVEIAGLYKQELYIDNTALKYKKVFEGVL